MKDLKKRIVRFNEKILKIMLVIGMVLVIMPNNNFEIKAEENNRPGIKLSSIIDPFCNNVVLESGIYYVDEDLTIRASEYAGAAAVKKHYTVKIADNSDVTIIVDKGVTLEAIGLPGGEVNFGMRGFDGKALYNRPSYSGFEVPSSSTLTFRGEGKVIAKGGDGVAAENGNDGMKQNMFIINAIVAFSATVTQKYSGEGGNGAYAPSPGIGGKAGNPGSRGSNKGGASISSAPRSGEMLNAAPEAGANGGNGENGGSMGTVRVLDNITLIATAGKNYTSAAIGGSGSDGVSGSVGNITGRVTFGGAGHGGGGAGSIAGYSADIGGAGGSGGSGGSGGAGGTYLRGNEISVSITDGTNGTGANGKVAGNGGSSGTLTTDYCSHGVVTGGVGGKQGLGGNGGNVYLSNTAKVNDVTTNNLELLKTRGTGGNPEDGDGERATPHAVVPVSVTIKHDDQINESTKNHKVSLYKDGSFYCSMTNFDINTGAIKDNYDEFIGTDGNYEIYVDGMRTGQTLSKDNRSATVDFYTIKATVNKDGLPYSDRKIDLIQNNAIMYSLKEESSGLYKALVLKTYLNEDSNSYEVLLDSKETFDSVKNTKKDEAAIGFNYVTAKVFATVDDVVQENQTVILKQNGKNIYYLNDLGNNCCEDTLLLYNSTATKGDNKYVVNINGEDVPDSVLNLEDSCEFTAKYYTVNVELKKDDQIWPSATVVLQQDGEIGKRLKFDVNSQKYSGVVPSWGGQYDVRVLGTNDDGLTGETISKEQRNASAIYYSVNFRKNHKDQYESYLTYIIQSGGKVEKPKDPSRNDATFDKWVTDLNSEILFNFETPITESKNVFALWQLPKIVIGTVVYCDDNDAINPNGDYYHMTNATLTGLPSSGGCVSAIVLDYTNAEIDTTKINYQYDKYEGAGANSAISGNDKTTEKISYIFKEKLTLAQAQKFIRTIKVKPDNTGKKHTMRITVYCNTNAD